VSTNEEMDELREDMKLAKAAGFKAGDVVKWMVAKKYTVAALYVAGRWWITGKGNFYEGRTDMTHQEFTEILEYTDVSDIVVSSGWESVEE
jgi:hypothetical protein